MLNGRRVLLVLVVVLLALTLLAIGQTTSDAQSGTSTACGVAPDGYNVIESNERQIQGTNEADFICGGDAANVIKGRGGHDIIYAGAGNDRIAGGAGNDVMYGGDGNDKIGGAGGDDVLEGEAGDDVLKGGRGGDTLNGGEGNDRLFGAKGPDTLDGGDGDDVVKPGGGDDTILGEEAEPEPEPEPEPEDLCPDETFQLSVNDIERTDGYPNPELAVTCTDDTMTVVSNGMIGYEFVQITPNDLGAQDYNFALPLEPVEAATPGSLPLGTVGVSINGIAIFGAFEAPNMGYRDPLLDGLLDFCNGHTAMRGQYHYHARFDCILDDPTAPEAVIGYLFDGYEIVTPFACNDLACGSSREVSSSYVRTDQSSTAAFEAWEYQAGSGDLDECNGMVSADGTYRYYVTDAFPYVPFCFHGESTYANGDFTGAPPTGGRP